MELSVSMALDRLRAVALRLIVVAGAIVVSGQSTLAQTMCGSAQGLCPANPAPVGAPCVCFGPMGPAPGRIAAVGGGVVQQPGLSNSCRTFRGFCHTAPAPVGSQCGCFGDYGTVVLR